MAATIPGVRQMQLIGALILIVNYFSMSLCARPFKHFSSKTPYAWVHSQTEGTEDELYYLELPGMACSAVHATAVIRHGARYPGLEDVQDIARVHEKIVAAIEPDTNLDLYNWVNKFPSNNNKALSPVGEVEQESLGRRTAKKLSTLFAEEDITKIRFIVSSMERTKQSASAFYEGFAHILYGEEDIEEEFDSEVNDDLMRFFSLCAKYVYSVEKNKTAFHEYHSFLSSDKVVSIKNKVQEKLGITDDVLTTANVRLIYLICGYETAVFNTSPWCSLLDDDDMEVLEYLGDLKHYYKNAYGYNITWEQSCPLLSEIFFAMDEVIVEIENSDDEDEMDGFIVGQFAFGHAETLGPLYAALGIFNDSEPLRADNYEQQNQRQFRTSEILPFSANIMFILYECVPEQFRDDEEVEEADYYVKLLVNEKPVQIPGCKKEYCPYDTVRDYYHSLVDTCEFKKICRKPATKDEL